MDVLQTVPVCPAMKGTCGRLEVPDEASRPSREVSFRSLRTTHCWSRTRLDAKEFPSRFPSATQSSCGPVHRRRDATWFESDSRRVAMNRSASRRCARNQADGHTRVRLRRSRSRTSCRRRPPPLSACRSAADQPPEHQLPDLVEHQHARVWGPVLFSHLAAACHVGLADQAGKDEIAISPRAVAMDRPAPPTAAPAESRTPVPSTIERLIACFMTCRFPDLHSVLLFHECNLWVMRHRTSRPKSRDATNYFPFLSLGCRADARGCQ